MRKIKALIITPFIIGNCILSTGAYGQESFAKVENLQTIRELTNRKNVLLLSNLMIRKSVTESVIEQSGNLVLKETKARIAETILATAAVSAVTRFVAMGISLMKNSYEIHIEESVARSAKFGTVFGGLFGIIVTQYNYEVINKVEQQQLRKLKSMNDEEIINEYSSIVSEIARVSDSLNRSVENNIIK